MVKAALIPLEWPGRAVFPFVCLQTKDQPRSAYDEDNMIQSIFDLFLGGTETSSTTLYWALLYMLMYPDIQGKRGIAII